MSDKNSKTVHTAGNNQNEIWVGALFYTGYPEHNCKDDIEFLGYVKQETFRIDRIWQYDNPNGPTQEYNGQGTLIYKRNLDGPSIIRGYDIHSDKIKQARKNNKEATVEEILGIQIGDQLTIYHTYNNINQNQPASSNIYDGIYGAEVPGKYSYFENNKTITFVPMTDKEFSRLKSKINSYERQVKKLSEKHAAQLQTFLKIVTI